MIFYAEDLERWEDTEDQYWFVDMTPDFEDRYKTFTNKIEFYEWYQGV